MGIGQPQKPGKTRDSQGLNENDPNRSFDQRLFALLERIAVAVEMQIGDEDHEALQDRAIGLLHRIGYSRRRVAEEMGRPEATMRGPKWARFNAALEQCRSMQRGLDVARMRRHGPSEDEGEE
jgi:hypothetical protein